MGSALLVEDDAGMSAVVRMTLESAGHRVVVCTTGAEGLTAFEVGAYEGGIDLVVLDLMLPDMDGLDVCRSIRASSDVPIIMITARDAATDIVAGLEAGADDYLTKPFEAPVLVARTRALQRRVSVPGTDASADSLRAGRLLLDTVAHRVTRDGAEIALTVTEFNLLAELIRHTGQALSRQQLLELVWGYDHLGDSRVVDMAVRRLRGKIEADPASPRAIETVRGVGYRLRAT